ncbi:MAG: PEP-CTERM sorting domain-containing protein [Deltaproteobacteria bacterium]|nr:PEP-CTERM sorting domain-containing protein [Deltaproteobacteria bacterium]
MNAMMKKILFSLTLFVLVIFSSGVCFATQYCNYLGCVDFPGGISSFADAVVSYTPGSGGLTADFMDPQKAIGAPNQLNPGPIEYVSLGSGGSIILRFTDNSLTGSGTSAYDLWIFEVGPDVESTSVKISKDGFTWSDIGLISGSTRGIDIDAYGFTTTDFFPYVWLTDDPNQGATTGASVGADIDAIGAISTAPPVATPEPATMLLLGSGLLGLWGSE